MKLTDEQVDWLCERIPDHPPSALGGRPPAYKRNMLQGIFRILDNGAKWNDLPVRLGSKSTVHRWFLRWVKDGVFERIIREAGGVVEQRDGFQRSVPNVPAPWANPFCQIIN
ncbi:MAG: transposase [Phycisphaeraceae bacterium]|nr:transposase [Phycisphaeraceae bacterium]